MSLSLIRQADYKPTKDKLIRLKQSLDDGIFASTGKSGMELERLKNSLYDADVKYSQMKRIEDDSLYEGIQKGTTKELTQAKLDKKFRNTNGKLNEYLSGLDAPSRERLEIEAIKNTLERNIKETMGGKRVVDYSGMLKTLKDNPNYKSEAAKKAIEITEKMNKIHGLDHTLADAFKAPKDPKLQQGLSHNVAVRYLTMAANRAVQNTVKFLPFLQMGKTAASRHAIYNAVMSSSSVQELGEKLSKAAMNKDIPISEKIDIIEMAKAQFKFSNELDKAKADGIVKETAEQGSKIEQAEAKQEAVKGEGWTMRDGGEAKTDYVIKTDLAPNVRDLSKITTDEISADLEYLSGKHPEIFDKPSDVFRLVKDIKENPTHFFTNNRLDYALIVKRLKNNKIGKLAIDKQSGEVKHATRVKDKDLKRLAKVSEEKSGNAGIIQTFTRPGSKLENQGLGYQDEAIISQKGNLVNEKEANGLRDSVSSVGDNANRRRMNAEERGQWQGRPPSLHTDTKPAGANGASARSLTTDNIIPQNPAKDELEIKTYATPHVGTGLAGGTLNAKDENGNFDAEKFAKGFIYGLFGSKITAATLKKTNPKLYDQIVKIAEGNASKEKISSFVNKLKQDELGKLLQKTVTNKDLSTKTKVEIIEAAKSRYAQEIK